MKTETIEKILLYSIWANILLILFMPLIVTPQTIFPFIVGKAIYSRVLIEVAFGLWVVLAVRNPSYRIPRSWLLLIVFIYLTISIMAGVFGVSFQRSLWSTYERMQGLVDLTHWAAFVLVITAVFRSLPDWRWLFSANLAASLVFSLLGIAQHYGWSIPFYGFLQADKRLDITLGNPTFVGAYALVNLFIAMGLLAHSLLSNSRRDALLPSRRRGRRRAQRQRRESRRNSYLFLLRIFWGLAFVLNLWVLTLSGTRGAFLGLVAGLLALAIVYVIFARLRVVRFAALGLIISLVGIALITFSIRNSSAFERLASSNVLVDRLTNVSLNEINIRSRLSTLSIGTEGFTARPILGWGPENYLIVYGRYFRTGTGTFETLDQAHNKPVEELVTKGTIGFISYLAIWGFAFWVLLNRAKGQETDSQALTLFVGAALLGYFVQNLFLFDTPAVILQLMLLLGFVINLEATFGDGSAEIARNRQKQLRSRANGDSSRASPLVQLLARVNSIRNRFPVLERLLGYFRARVLNTTEFRIAGTIAVLALVVFSIYFVNIRAYNAATTILQVNNPANTFGQAIEYFEESIDSFPPLANYPRLILFSNLANNWDDFTESQARQALTIVEKEAPRAIESEPQNWRIYKELAHFYQKAASVDPGYVERARGYLDKASELAPERDEVLNLISAQELVENKLKDES